MRRSLAYLTVLLAGGLYAQPYAQGNWNGGDGVCGVVTSWGTQFCSQDSVAWGMPGQINPVATAYDWSRWILDTVELTGPGPYGNAYPYDMDGDGDIDLVGYRSNTVLAVYLNDGLGNFTPMTVENVSSFYGGKVWPVWVKDVNLDGRPDILAPMKSGLYVYYQTGSLTFTRSQIVSSSSSYWCGTYISYADAGDVDNDGDVDIVATNGCGPGSGGGGGDVVLFRNNGTSWTPVMIYNSSDDNHKAMRIYLVDLNDDGWLDIVTSYWPVLIFRNTGGSFSTPLYFGGSYHNSDGLWPIDVDADGDIDIAYAPYQSGYYLSYLRNDGSFSFVRVDVASGTMYDGLYAGDFNGDGLTDFLGGLGNVDIYVAPSYTRYTLSSGWNIHNLYFANVDNYGCFDIQQDIVFTNLSSPYGHFIYRNRTITTYASYAELVSSILEAPIGSCSFDTLKYIGCVPDNWELEVYVRWGGDSTDVPSAPWVGPVASGTSLIDLGLHPSGDNYIQYKVVFRRTGPPTNNAPMLDSIWIVPNCDILGDGDDLSASEVGRVLGLEVRTAGGKVILKGRGTYEVFASDGRLVKRGNVVGEVVVPLGRGVYFVRANGKVYRVVSR